MNSNDFVSVNHLLAEILTNVNDKELRNGITKGWYVSRIQDALQELAFDTFYQTITQDFNMPKNLALPMPKNAFNVREIYVFNTSCCSPLDSKIVHWKRQFNNKYGADTSKQYTAKVKEGNYYPNQFWNSDPYYPKVPVRSSTCYASIQNGIIMLSSSCSGYSQVRLVYNGMGVEIGDEPVVPRMLERAVVDYVEERFFNVKRSEDPRKYRGVWNDAYARLDKSMRKARVRLSSMDSFEKESLDNYLSGIIHK